MMASNGLLSFLFISCMFVLQGEAIINGTDVTSTSPLAKSMVSLQYNGTHRCGGVLIDGYSILSAAHCYPLILLVGLPSEITSVDDAQLNPPTDITAVIGTTQLSAPNARRVRIDRMIWPDNFPDRYRTMKIFTVPYNESPNDYMIFKLQERVPESANIKYATLADQTGGAKNPRNGDHCDIIGYGRYVHPDGRGNPEFSDRLRRAQVVFKPDSQCYPRNTPTNMMGCSKQRFSGTKGLGVPCLQDSGGPMFCQTSSGQKYLAGIGLGSAIPCNRPDTFILSLRVSAIRRWIDHHLGPAV